MLLDKIERANDIKKIDKSDYGELAEEIRQFLIHTDLLNQELPDLLRQFPVVRFIYFFNIICSFDFIQ